MRCIQFSTVLLYLHVSHGHVGGTSHCSENTDAVNMPLNFGLGVEERCIWILILWWNKKVDSSSNSCKIKLTFWEEEPVVCHFVPDLVPVCVQHPNDSIVVTNSSIDYHILSLTLRMENMLWRDQLFYFQSIHYAYHFIKFDQPEVKVCQSQSPSFLVSPRKDGLQGFNVVLQYFWNLTKISKLQ